jgi:hypothetical protein
MLSVYSYILDAKWSPLVVWERVEIDAVQYFIFTTLLRIVRKSIEIKEIYYGNITIIILDISHRPVIYLKRYDSETKFCLRYQVEPTRVGSIDRVSASGDGED